MDDLIACTNCEEVANDILLMYCDHHLCLKCAILRLNSQYQNKKPTGKIYLICKKCKKKTNLDQESITQITKMKKSKNQHDKTQNKMKFQKPYNCISRNSQTKRINHDKSFQGHSFSLSQSKISKQKNIIHQFKSIKKNQKQSTYKNEDESLISKEGNYGLCEVHTEQPIMFYCFDCQIHCFCAQCVLLGKHNNHNVKIIKKAYILVEKQFTQLIQTTQKFVLELSQKNKLITQNITNSKTHINEVKKNIQKQFDKVRTLIKTKQQQLLKLVQKQMTQILDTCNTSNKKIIDEKLHQQEQLLLKINNSIKNGQVEALNFYADQWTQVTKIAKKQEINLSNTKYNIDEALAQLITQLIEEIQKIKVKQIMK